MPVIVARQTFGCSIDYLTQMFEERPEQWLTSFVRLACHDGEADGLRANPELAEYPADPKPTCVVTVGQPRFHPSGAVIFPVRWIAIGYRAIARAFSGHFEFTSSDGMTDVLLSGMCKGERGRTFEMRRASRVAAEAALRSLLANLTAAVAAATVSLPGTVTGAGPSA